MPENTATEDSSKINNPTIQEKAIEIKVAESPTSLIAQNDTGVTDPKSTISDSEEHYKNLVAYFKDIFDTTIKFISVVSVLIAALGSISVWFNYKTISDVKNEVKDAVTSLKTEAKSSIEMASAGTRTALDNIKADAKDTFSKTQGDTTAAISQVSSQASTIALTEAQRRVDAAFKGDNIQLMVEKAAKLQIAPVIERQLKGEVDRAMDSVQTDITWLGQLVDAGAYLRNGGRDGLDRIVAIQKEAPTENIKLRARSILFSISDDYEKVIKRDMAEHKMKAFELFISYYAQGESTSFLSKEDTPKARKISYLINVIHKSSDLMLAATAFLALRDITNIQFRVFDFEAIDKWCAEHPAECTN